MGVNPDVVLRELDGMRALARALVSGAAGDAEADDLIQDAAIAAITHPPATDRPVRPWLGAVLRNRWRMNRRGDARRRARELATVPAAEALPDEKLDRARALERLGAALVALDEPFKTTVIRRYLDGESAAEIARALGVPAGTVRWRLKTGLDRLRASLDDSTPSWKRMLAPIGVGKGALLVKAKTSIVALVVLVLLLGVGAFLALRGRHDGASATAGAGGAARGHATVALPGGRAAEGSVATPPAKLAAPGQQRAVTEAVAAAGGVVEGRVINWSTGDGVDGAEVTFYGPGGAATLRSAADGTFQLAPEAPGSFLLTAVSAPGFLPYAPELAHSGVRVELAANRAVRGITVFLFPAIDYQGHVVDAAGAPVAGAHVRMLGTPTGEQAIEKLTTEWTTDSAGAFTFHAGDFAVLEATAGTRRGFAQLDGKVALTHQLLITLGDAPARDATIRGKTVDAAGAPLADVLVRADPQGPPGQPPQPGAVRAVAFATSGSDGTFVLEGVDRGLYALSAEIEDRAPASKSDVAGGTTDVTLTLEPGLVIAGKVVSTADEPIPSYTLLVLRREGLLRSFVLSRSIVDAAGAFRVHVPAGDFELLASGAGWAPSAPTQVSAGTTDARLVVSPGASLRGTIVDAESHAPVSYARITREAPGGGASALPANAGTVSRPDGTFELTGIPPGPLSITIGAAEYHPKIEAGMTATDGATLGPVTIALTKLRDGETPSLELVGIGVKLSSDGPMLRVEQVFPESGAAAAGIVAGDLLVTLDGVPVTSLGMDGAIAKIRGAEGTTIAVGVQRGDQVVQVVVTRKKLHA